ncbi:MAG: DUF4276 family protein [Magnetococcales bacterium]|nr:DUF4276 family protein [Magnetococcales bacterium]
MKIALIVEGDTEKAFIPCLRAFLEEKLSGRMPSLRVVSYNGRIPKHDKLKRIVENLLGGKSPAHHVIALTDVYTGTSDFQDASDAKDKMRQWVPGEPRFHPHAAQHDFEAWLLPYWSTIQRLAGHNGAAPKGQPESVNHNKPPADQIAALFAKGSSPRHYVKPRDALRILKDNDLSIAIGCCPELKSLINTILKVCGGSQIP